MSATLWNNEVSSLLEPPTSFWARFKPMASHSFICAVHPGRHTRHPSHHSLMSPSLLGICIFVMHVLLVSRYQTNDSGDFVLLVIVLLCEFQRCSYQCHFEDGLVQGGTGNVSGVLGWSLAAWLWFLVCLSLCWV